MQIVIDIPDHYYENNIKKELPIFLSEEEVVTILPKRHGRLIDADELYEDFIDGTEGYDCQTWNRIEIGDIIEDAPTIIEANTESEDKE